MAIIYTYPSGTPSASDNILGTQVDPITEENKTVQFGIQDVANLATNNYLETTVTVPVQNFIEASPYVGGWQVSVQTNNGTLTLD